ncbi:MAG: cyclopropane-fatty-acyl-phospholipid synthase [Candidatus Peregrinibacteria bacterium Gr01-1014_25]|nr:MAG: cyclopropane-fatty-acyl-phospholipid synthase [Candidatus Peregrinibacteria bacterium Gr01-1014_25]
MSRKFVEGLLERADIRTDGARPWDMRVHDERVFDRMLADGNLGLGEAYMDGWWDCDDLEEFFVRLIRSDVRSNVGRSWKIVWYYLRSRFLNLQNRRRSWRVNWEHYDIDNDLYAQMLDRRMVYTCAYWKDADSLDGAQEAKLDLICRKLGLRKGQRLLDIGCGFGGLAAFAAQRYGATVTGITLSKEQRAAALEKCRGLPVEIRLQDYRDLGAEQFDHIASVEMIEAVGHRNFRMYMETAHRCLKSGGLFVLQAIGQNASSRSGDPWLDRYIFPNGMLPSVAQLGKAIDGLFVLEDWHNFGQYYVKTLRSWHKNFLSAWPVLAQRYSERFKRMWEYYLLSCAGAMRSRHIQLWQIVLSKGGVMGGYVAPR